MLFIALAEALEGLGSVGGVRSGGVNREFYGYSFMIENLFSLLQPTRILDVKDEHIVRHENLVAKTKKKKPGKLWRGRYRPLLGESC